MGGEQYVHRVRVKNRVDCCGERLAATKITIGNEECGSLPTSTSTGQWYEVKCKKPVKGDEVRLTTTKNAYL
jgi:hypothetical protein